jgi:hypothetical protein
LEEDNRFDLQPDARRIWRSRRWFFSKAAAAVRHDITSQTDKSSKPVVTQPNLWIGVAPVPLKPDHPTRAVTSC